MEFAKSLSLPFKSFKKLIFGSILFIIPFVNIITGLFGYGYAMAVAKNSMKQQFKLPEWKNFGSLFYNGLIALFIGLVWFIPATIITIIAVLFVATSINLAAVTSGLALIIGGFLFLLTWFFIPCGIMEYIHKGKFSAAFSKEVFKRALTGSYIIAWLLAFIISILTVLIILGISSGLTTIFGSGKILIPVISLIVNGILAYIQSVMIFSLYAQGWRG